MEFSFVEVNEAVSAAIPDREAVVFRDRRLTYAQLAERSRRLANVLLDHGIEVRAERSTLQGFESGQDHLALYLYNGNEYLEGMLGAWKARSAAFNVNYRYVEEELRYLFENSRSRAVIYHSAFAPQIAAMRDRLPQRALLLQVDHASATSSLPGSVDYQHDLGAAPLRPRHP